MAVILDLVTSVGVLADGLITVVSYGLLPDAVVAGEVVVSAGEVAAGESSLSVWGGVGKGESRLSGLDADGVASGAGIRVVAGEASLSVLAEDAVASDGLYSGGLSADGATAGALSIIDGVPGGGRLDMPVTGFAAATCELSRNELKLTAITIKIKWMGYLIFMDLGSFGEIIANGYRHNQISLLI